MNTNNGEIPQTQEAQRPPVGLHEMVAKNIVSDVERGIQKVPTEQMVNSWLSGIENAAADGQLKNSKGEVVELPLLKEQLAAFNSLYKTDEHPLSDANKAAIMRVTGANGFRPGLATLLDNPQTKEAMLSALAYTKEEKPTGYDHLFSDEYDAKSLNVQDAAIPAVPEDPLTLARREADAKAAMGDQIAYRAERFRNGQSQ